MKEAWTVLMAAVLIPLLVVLSSALVSSCSGSSSDDDDTVPVVGTSSGQLPDARVFVIDSSTGAVRILDGHRPDTGGVSDAIDLGGATAGGVALDPYADRIWITLRDTDSVRVYEGKSLTLLSTVTVGDNPGAIAIDGVNGRVFVANENDNNMSVLSANPPYTAIAGSPVATGTTPSDVAVVASNVGTSSSVVVANQVDGTISVFDTNTLAAVTGSPFTVGTTPVDLEVDPATGLVFVANQGSGTLSIFSTDNRTVAWDNGTSATLVAGEFLSVSGVAIGVVTAQTGGAGLTGTVNYTLLGTTDLADNDNVTASNSGKIFSVDGDPTVSPGMAPDLTGLTSPVQVAHSGRRGQIYVAESSGNVRVYTSSASPNEFSQSPAVVGGTLGGIAVNGFMDRVYVSVSSTGLIHVLNANTFAEVNASNRPAVGTAPGVSLAFEPALLRTLIPPAGGDVESSFVSDGLLLMTQTDPIGTLPEVEGLLILDNADPRASMSAALTAQVRLEQQGGHHVVVDHREYAYVSNDDNGIHVVDISNRFQPFVERTLNGLSVTNEIHLSGESSSFRNGFLIVDAGTTGTHVVDVRDPTHPVLADTVGVGGLGYDYTADDRYVYSINAQTAIDINVIDMSAIPTFALAETIDISVAADDVAALPNSVAVVATGPGGLRFVNIRPPTTALLGHVDLGAAAEHVDTHKSLVFASDINDQLHIINATDPNNPVEIGVIPLTSEVEEIRVFGNDLHIADGSAGLLIYRLLP